MNWKIVLSFASLYTERLPTEKEAPALKSKPSSLTEICSYPHRQAKCLLEKSFRVLWTEQTKTELFDHNGKRSVWGTAPIQLNIQPELCQKLIDSYQVSGRGATC